MERTDDQISGSLTFPSVSVIMPVRNEADFIARSLAAVLTQDYPQHLMEVFVVDGMSTDNTRGIVSELAAKHAAIPIEIIDNPGQIVPKGMNLALRKARGEIIVRVDGHCEIAPDYVRRCVEHLVHDGVDGVGGPIETIGSTPLSEAIALAMSSKFGVGDSAFRTVKDKTMLADTVAFPAYTHAIINRAGAYDEELVRNQDDEYNYRLRSLGAKILLAPDIRSKYYSRSSFRSLWKQYFQYGLYKVRVMQKHPRQMRMRQFVPPLFVTGVFGGAVVGTIISPLLIIWGGILLLYVLLNTLVSFRLASQHGWSHLRRLPAIFIILHLSYGSGFLAGLLKFTGRWNDKGTTPNAAASTELIESSQ